jgi:hypothetical protein
MATVTMALASASLDSLAYSVIFLHALRHVLETASVSHLDLKWHVYAMRVTKAMTAPKNLALMIVVAMVNVLMGFVCVKMAGAMQLVRPVVQDKVLTAAVMENVLKDSVFAMPVGLVMLATLVSDFSS